MKLNLWRTFMHSGICIYFVV
uniref:Uncharacterized protein n=1 Tax=Arundo donax TaxID=35708 RepID=A0A0A9GJP0_ARUDO